MSRANFLKKFYLKKKKTKLIILARFILPQGCISKYVNARQVPHVPSERRTGHQADRAVQRSYVEPEIDQTYAGRHGALARERIRESVGTVV